MYFPRFSFGTAITRIDIPATIILATPIPCTDRAATNPTTVEAKAIPAKAPQMQKTPKLKIICVEIRYERTATIGLAVICAKLFADKMMDLFVLLPQDITTRDLEVDIKRDALRVGIKGSSDSPLLEGPLHGIVRASECWWVVTDEGGQRCVHAQLQKLPPYDILWASVIKGDGGAGNPLSVQQQ